MLNLPDINISKKKLTHQEIEEIFLKYTTYFKEFFTRLDIQKNVEDTVDCD